MGDHSLIVRVGLARSATRRTSWPAADQVKADTSGSIVLRRENHLLLLSREKASDDLGHALLEEFLAPRGGGVVDEGAATVFS